MRFGASLNHAIERRVHGHAKRIFPNRLAQPRRNMKALEGQHTAHIRIHQEQPHIFARIRHRKHTAAVAVQEVCSVEPI